MISLPLEFKRTEMLLGAENIHKLASARVAVFGAGGVGGYVLEALTRAGVGAIDVIDNDKIDVTNINRQILAVHSTVGELKTDAAIRRIKDINPQCTVTAHNVFFLPETADIIDFSAFDYVVDAIDTVAGKKQIVLSSKQAGVPVISCMGTGNKLDPTAFKVADIFDTSVCPLARMMRDFCRKSGIKKLKTVYSPEIPAVPKGDICGDARTPGSVSFVPSVAGLIIAAEVIKDLIMRRPQYE